MSDRPEAWDAAESVPTPQEMAVVKRFADTGYDITKLRDCADKAGVSRSVAKRAFEKIQNNPKLQKALKKKGVTFERIAAKLDELLDAKHPQYPTQNDNIAQGKALELAVKIMDGLPTQKIELDKTEKHVLVLAPETIEAIQRVKGIQIIDVEPTRSELEADKPKGYFE